MATVKELYEDEYLNEQGQRCVMRDGRELFVAKNGALYSKNEKGQTIFHKGAKVTTAITTSERGRELAQVRAELRKKIVFEAANDAVERNDFKTLYGNYAFVAAIINVAMVKATTPDDPKAIEAGRFVLAQAGMLNEGEEDVEKNKSVLEALGREAIEQVLLRAKAAREAG